MHPWGGFSTQPLYSTLGENVSVPASTLAMARWNMELKYNCQKYLSAQEQPARTRCRDILLELCSTLCTTVLSLGSGELTPANKTKKKWINELQVAIKFSTTVYFSSYITQNKVSKSIKTEKTPQSVMQNLEYYMKWMVKANSLKASSIYGFLCYYFSKPPDIKTLSKKNKKLGGEGKDFVPYSTNASQNHQNSSEMWHVQVICMSKCLTTEVAYRYMVLS